MNKNVVVVLVCLLLLLTMLEMRFDVVDLADRSFSDVSNGNLLTEGVGSLGFVAPDSSWRHDNFENEARARGQDMSFRDISYVEDEKDSFAYFDDDSAYFVIGVSNERPNGYVELADLIVKNEGIIIDKVSIGGKLRAIVADILFKATSPLKSEAKAAGLSTYFEPSIKFKVDFVPNDPYWPEQWGPRKIEADYAWNTTKGNTSVLVAVIDSGIDWDHPDLAANYVALGYDWVNNDTDPMDDYGHGTHCAGIIAGVLNNSVGVAGLAQVQIMAEKAFTSAGLGTDVDVAKAIAHAVDQGANILSCSWGGESGSTLLHEAIKYAYDKGVLVIAAAGNYGTYTKIYPAVYEEVIAVTATDESDKPAFFTNYGDWVELAAPGVNIYSTMWDNRYATFSGTSMACPHVAGVAALIWSKFPDMSQDWVRLQLRYTADDLGETGFDWYYGYGRVNARKAVEQVPPDHDLFIFKCERPPYVEPEHTGTIETYVFNFGINDESNIAVQLLINDTIVDSAVISFLASGAGVTVTLSWNPTIEGKYNVTAYVAPVPGEIIVTNNVDSAYVNVAVPIKAFVLRSWGTKYYRFWMTLNTNWRAFGNKLIYIDYMSLAHEDITYADIVATGADVLIISSAYGRLLGNCFFTNQEIAAVKRYILEGHGLIATGLTFWFQEVAIHNKLGPLFGLREDIEWEMTVTNMIHILDPTHPLFANVPDPLTFQSLTSPIPPDSLWDSNELIGGTYVALGPYKESAIVTHRGLVFISPHLECPRLDKSFDKSIQQLFYNAITWSTYQIPEHELTVSLDSPTFLPPGNSTLLKATLFNVGLYNETNVELQILVNGSVLGHVVIPEIVNGSSYMLYCEWTPTLEGLYNVTAYASPVHNEHYIQNNIMSMSTLCTKTKKRILWDLSHDAFYSIRQDNLLHIVYVSLYRLLTSQGYAMDQLYPGPLDQEVLSQYDILVLIDPEISFLESEIEDIQNWVASGGALLVIPDFYDEAISIEPSPNLNRLLAPYGVQLTGLYSGWNEITTDIVEHPITRNVKSIWYHKACALEVTEPSEILAWTKEPYAFLSTTMSCEVIVIADSNIMDYMGLGSADNKQLILNIFDWIGGKYDHDLAVTLNTPSIFELGDPLTIKATVANRGLNNETNVAVQLLINGAIVNSTLIPKLPVGSSYSLTYLLRSTTEASYNVTVYAAPVPGENITDNNALSSHIAAYIPRRILAYTEFSSTYEYENVLEAIDSTFGPAYILTELRNYTKLDSMLLENDILLIPEQENADLSSLENIGRAWSTTLLKFVNQGKVIILCDYKDGDGGTYGILTGAGLMSISGTNQITGSEIYLLDPTNPLAHNIHTSFTASKGTIDFITNETNVVFDDGTYPVVILKAVGKGKIVLLGFDYFESNLWTKRILGNAVGLELGYEHELSASLYAPAHLEPSNSSLLNVTIYNHGLNNETNVKLQLLINGSKLESTIISSLPPRSCYTFSYIWTPTVEATYNLTAYVLPQNGEITIMNNADEAYVNVYFLPCIYISPSTTARAIGQSFTVNITIRHARDIYAWQLKLKWNASLLNITNIVEGNFLKGEGNTIFIPTVYQNEGYIHIGCALSEITSGAIGNGTLATVTFLAEKEGECALNFYDTTLLTQSATVHHKVVQGYFKWTVLGDVDGDGDVDIFDAVNVCSRFGAKKGDRNWDFRADLNSDGVIDTDDVMIICANYGRRRSE